MAYNSKKSRRHKSPHQNEGDKQQPFFSKTKADPSQSNGAFFQTKLTIGEPGDQYEQEADAMADHVVNDKSQKGSNAEAGSDIQQKEEAVISRMGEEEEAQAKPEIQQQEEEEVAQAKPEIQAEEEEEAMQAKPEINRAAEPQEEEMASAKHEPGARTASPQISNQIKQSQGKGKKLPSSTQQEMSSAFGYDFSEVNVHTGEESEAMNKELQSQAFTHKNDVFFNEGKYDPESDRGKHLLAHELTHVVQQNKK